MLSCFPKSKTPSLLCREGAGGESSEFFATLPDPASRVDPLFKKERVLVFLMKFYFIKPKRLCYPIPKPPLYKVERGLGVSQII